MSNDNVKVKKLYLLKRTDDGDYGDVDSIVVCALSEESAKEIYPEYEDIYALHIPYPEWITHDFNDWVKDIKHIDISFLGIAEKDIKLGVVHISRLSS